MSKIVKEGIDRFYDYDLHLETRTIFLADGDDGEINAAVANKFIKSLHLLVAQGIDKPISVYVNSFGGCWYNGMAIYDAIKFCPAVVNAFIVGTAMSMGSIVIQAADKRIIYPNATVMVHDGTFSQDSMAPASFQNWADHYKKIQPRMYRIYAERTGKSAGFWRRKCNADLILSATEALELGLVDEIYGVSNG